MNFNIDLSVIIIYLVAIVGIGLYMSRRAAAGLDNYFLSGRKMPAVLLAIPSGSMNSPSPDPWPDQADINQKA